MRYNPSALVTVSNETAVATLRMTTETPGSAAPELSLTRPEMVLLPLWAKSAADANRKRMEARRASLRTFMNASPRRITACGCPLTPASTRVGGTGTGATTALVRNGGHETAIVYILTRLICDSFLQASFRPVLGLGSAARLAARRGGAGHLRIQPRKRRVVEDSGRCVTYFLHGKSNAARLFVETFVAFSISGLADAGGEGKRPLEHPNYLSDRDFCRFPAKDVAAAPPLLAVQQARSL